MFLQVSSGGVPVGSYSATFTNLEPVDNEFGPGLRWQFEISAGQYKGLCVSRTTSNKPTVKNTCGRMLGAIAGKPLSIGLEFDVGVFLGKPYLVVVAEGTTGSTRVEAVTQMPQSD